MDLRCVNAGSGDSFYKSHLPRLGPFQQIADSRDQSTEESSSLSSITDEGLDHFLPPVKDHDRNTCPLSITSSSGSDDVTSPLFQVKVNYLPMLTKYSKHTKTCLTTFSNSEKRVENTTRGGVF